MSENVSHNSQSGASIEKFKAQQEAELAEMQEHALLKEIFGNSLIGDSSEDERRVQEGADYYKHLEELSDRQKNEAQYSKDLSSEMIEGGGVVYDKGPKFYAGFEYDNDRIDEIRAKEITETIESIPKLRSLNSMAEQISNAYKDLDPLDSLQADSLKRDKLGRLRERFASTFERYSELGLDSRAESDDSVDQQEFLDNFNYYNNKGLIKDSLVRILDKADFSDLLTEASHDQALGSENVSDDVEEPNVSSEKLEAVGELANTIEAIRVKKFEEREADITERVEGLRQIAQELNNLRVEFAESGNLGIEDKLGDWEGYFQEEYDNIEGFYGDEIDPRVLESLLNLAYDSPSVVENIELKPETVIDNSSAEDLTEDSSEKSSEAITDESDVVAPIVEADASSAETTEAQPKSEVENINDRIENVINDKYQETLGKLRELAHELYEAWRTSDPSYNEKLDYFNQKTSQIEDMFNLGYIEGDIESKEELADIKKAINRIKTEAGFDGLGTLRGLLRHIQTDKFKDRYGYDFARDNYLSERKNIINSLNNLNKKDPEVAAERKHIRNVLKELDNEFKSVEPYIRDENKITDKVKNKVKGAFETSPNVIATNELKNNLKDRFKGFVNTIGSGLKDFANYTPSERLAGETNRDYRARLSSESNSKFMSMAAIAKTIVPRR